jgi:hypothetical protein
VLRALGEEVTIRNPAGPPDMARLFDAWRNRDPFVVATLSVARDFVLQATRLPLQQLRVEIDLRAC